MAGMRFRLAALLLAVVVQGGSGATAQTAIGGQVNSSEPLVSASSVCQTPGATGSAQATPLASQRPDNNQGTTESQQVYQDSGGVDRQRNAVGRTDALFPPDPITDFQRLARSSTGEMLPIFGRDLFQNAPSTFAPADQVPVTADYVIGPGDEILVRLTGSDTLNSQLTVDTAGQIYLPKIGTIPVAGLRSDELQKQITTYVDRVFRNYKLAVNLGHLRSIQVYVVGEARRPGAYTISALSTVLNALFVSGGPNVQGSMRRIQVRREGEAPVEFDLYDLVLRGDKSKDIRLQSGDTLFIPAAGPQVAIGGSVHHPAIYELRGETTLKDLLQLAGGYTPTSAPGRVSVERIEAGNVRKALKMTVNGSEQEMRLQDGDVLFVDHISQGYEQSVTIRGNLANPGRFAWHPGMRLEEILPDRMSLLTNGYWRERNRLGVPEPLFEPSAQAQPYDFSSGVDDQGRRQDGTGAGNNQGQRNGMAAAQQNLPGQTNDPGQQDQGAGNGGVGSSPGTVPTVGMSGAADTGLRTNPQEKVRIPAPEIDWSYAVIERLDPNTLKNSLLPFNLGKLVKDHDPTQNLELQPGDIVTILSQADVPVPLDEQTKFIRLEGEFVSAGIYSVFPGETLRDVVRRAGGLTSKAYLYGSSFLRESARAFQQQRLNEYISTLSTDMERASAVRAASSASGTLDPNSLTEQRSLIAQLRQLRATGRVVLEFQPGSSGVDTVPDIPLENGDLFRIPSKPNTVSVIGAVYGQNVFLFNPERRVEDYISLAGKPNRIADRKHAFIIRADGSIYSRERAQGVWTNSFNNARINPGDSIVVPEKLIKPTALRELLDYSQILSSFGFAAAAIAVIR